MSKSWHRGPFERERLPETRERLHETPQHIIFQLEREEAKKDIHEALSLPEEQQNVAK